MSNSRRSSHSAHSHQTLSSTALENHLHALREKSNALSQTLTQKLATGQSGQNLLHIGPSLSTLPPDLYSLESNLTPLIKDVEVYDETCRTELSRIVQLGNKVRIAQRRSRQAKECAGMYHDLMAAEALLELDANVKLVHSYSQDLDHPQDQQEIMASLDMTRLDVSPHDDAIDTSTQDKAPKSSIQEKNILEHLSSLERTAHITLFLIQALKQSTDPSQISNSITGFSPNNKPNNSSTSGLPTLSLPLPQATEKSQLLMKLSPRIRKLERQVVASLVKRMEEILTEIGQQKEIELEMKQKEEDAAGEEKMNGESEHSINAGDSVFGRVSTQTQEQEVCIYIRYRYICFFSKFHLQMTHKDFLNSTNIIYFIMHPFV